LSASEYAELATAIGMPAEPPTCSPRRRRELLPAWMTPELIATPAARARLRAWVDAGSVAPSADALVRGVAFVGCDQVHSIVLDVLSRIAPPAADYLMRHALLCSVGWSARGWAVRTRPPADVRVVVLLDGSERDAAALRDVARHELAHGWLEDDPPEERSPALVAHLSAAALLAGARDPERMRAFLAVSDEREQRADALAAAWGARAMTNATAGRAVWVADAQRLATLYG
jgi:hypothetical protein